MTEIQPLPPRVVLFLLRMRLEAYVVSGEPVDTKVLAAWLAVIDTGKL